MAISGVTINLLAASQNRGILTTVALVRRDEFQAAVLVLLVVPAYKFLRPHPREVYCQ